MTQNLIIKKKVKKDEDNMRCDISKKCLHQDN